MSIHTETLDLNDKTRARVGSDNAKRPDFDVIVGLVQPGSKVLDLGCGDGDLLLRLAAERGATGRGIDKSERRIRECVGRGLSVLHGDIDDGLSDYPDNSFDLVILSRTLPYLNDPLNVVREMTRVGRQGIVTFENAGHWSARFRALRGYQVSGCSWERAPRARPITLADFELFCREAKLSITHTAHLSTSRVASNLFATIGIYVIERG